MMDYDVVVVGGGPIGALAARHAAEVGAHVLLVEQGDGSGEPVRCTGLVSPRTLDVFGAPSDVILRQIVGGRLHLPNGNTIELNAKETKALVIDRAAFDRALLRQAKAAGVEVHTHTRVTHAAIGRLSLNRDATITARVIIGADGPKSNVRKWFSLPPPQEFVVGRQVTVAGDLERADQVEVFVGSNVAPDGFAWAVPAERGMLRVGLLAPLETDVNTLLARFLADWFPGVVHAHTGGLIPIGLPSRTYGNGVLIVGDAAGQVKPLSGGGLYPGGVCARIAGRIGGQAALTGLTDAAHLQLYENQWRAELEPELRFGLTLRRFLFPLPDGVINPLGTIFSNPDILNVIASTGDLDYPRKLVSVFLAHRELWPRLLPALGILGGWDRVRDLAQEFFSSRRQSNIIDPDGKEAA